jgi:hypothetical protein
VKGVAIHGDHVVTDAPEKSFGLRIGTRCAPSGEQWQKVFFAGVGTLT